MNREFDLYHPIINFLFFLTIIVFTMMFMHPLFLIIGLLGAISYSTFINGMKTIRFNLIFSLPMIIVIAFINPLFSHKGMTILFYLNNKPITLESFYYGLASGTMIVSIMTWFTCYNKVMTSEKFIYLFGKTIPSISLIISMALGFIPIFKNKIKEIRNSQKNIGRDINCGSVIERSKQGLNILSILITWALENGVNTADSMKARGYGLRGRTNFSIYKFEKRDKIVLLTLILLIQINIIGYFNGICTMQFYPFIKINQFNSIDFIFCFSYIILVFLPLIIELREGLRWRYLRSKI